MEKYVNVENHATLLIYNATIFSMSVVYLFVFLIRKILTLFFSFFQVISLVFGANDIGRHGAFAIARDLSAQCQRLHVKCLRKFKCCIKAPEYCILILKCAMNKKL